MRSWRWLVMLLCFSANLVAVSTVTRFSVLEALLEVKKKMVGKIVRLLDSSDS